jgi:hypothetical protein
VSDWGFWLKRYPQNVAYHMFDKYVPVELPTTSDEESVKSRNQVDIRLVPDAPVLGISVGNESRAYPLSTLEREKLIRDTLAQKPVVIVWYPPTRSAVAYHPAGTSPKVETTRALSLQSDAKRPETPFVDEETGTHWDIAGRAADGQLKSWTLDWVDSVQVKWFAWVAEHPDTTLYGGRAK